MYKLLIVEDELWEREGLVSFIDWAGLNIEVAGTAANGVQGLQMARECLPDIIMTDIRMPLMDGLELSREVKKFLPKCKIIIITGYDDFQYAKDAIHIGINDYLLKPIQKEELLKTINKVKAGIQQEYQNEEYMSKLKTHLTECNYKERERFLLNILKGNGEYPEDLSNTDGLMSSFCSQSNVAVVIRVDAFSREEDQDCFKEFYKNIRELVGNKGLTLEKYPDKREIVIYLPVEQDSRSEVNELIKKIEMQDYGVNKPEYIIGVGSLSYTLSDFVKSFNQAQAAINRLFFLRDVDILFYDDLSRENESIEALLPGFMQFVNDYSKKILNAVVSLDGQEVIALTEEFFNYIYNNPVDKNLVCNFLASMINELSILLFSNDIPLGNKYTAGDDIIETFGNCIKLEQLKSYIQKTLVYTNQFFTRKRKNKEEYIIEDALSIINTDYNQNIGLEVIAQRLSISPNYLGNLFKKYVGKRFTEVLTSVRMKKAEELLLSGEDNIVDIAKAVGYDNITYFYTVFKKTHGISPMEYREKHVYDKKNME